MKIPLKDGEDPGEFKTRIDELGVELSGLFHSRKMTREEKLRGATVAEKMQNKKKRGLSVVLLSPDPAGVNGL